MTPELFSAVETILVVDDEAIVRAAIADYLRSCGYRVFEATNAEEALAILGDDGLRVDIVLSAVAMRSGMDGFGLSRWIREHRADIKIVLAGTPARPPMPPPSFAIPAPRSRVPMTRRSCSTASSACLPLDRPERMNRRLPQRSF